MKQVHITYPPYVTYGTWLYRYNTLQLTSGLWHISGKSAIDIAIVTNLQFYEKISSEVNEQQKPIESKFRLCICPSL